MLMTDSGSAKDDRQASEPTRSKQSVLMRCAVAVAGEPLVHFLLLGTAIFFIYARFQSEPMVGEEQLVVSAGKVEHLAAIFARTWQRPPTQAELQGLIDDYVREEVAYREGMELGLDEDDTIIRRRIRQKLDFVAEDLSNDLEPSNEALSTFFEEHREEYRIDPNLTFQHVYLNPDLHEASLEQDAAAVLDALRSDPQARADELGDRTLLDFRYERLSQADIGDLLGEEFAAAVSELAPGSWQGPIPSAFGYHLVFVEEHEPGRLPELEAVRHRVVLEWQHQQRLKLTEDFYRSLLKKYTVIIDWPQVIAEDD